MKTSHKITMDIPDEIFAGISDFKKKSKITDDAAAVFELIKYALSFPLYFKNYDWDKAEKEADNDIKKGRVKSFSSVDEFLADLKA
ncbi:MAG: hypothetical protein NT178_14255 [Proteobacteria bacterium]|nr:hypothetical protein [Pseudomonadota bacterium]